MFGFLFRDKQQDVRRLLENRLNNEFIGDFQSGKRQDARGPYFHVVWAVPFEHGSENPDWDAVMPVPTRNLCAAGVALIHRGDWQVQRQLIGLVGVEAVDWLVCETRHVTPMEFGFRLIGLEPLERIRIERSQEARIRRAIARFEQTGEPVPTVFQSNQLAAAGTA